MKSNPKGAKSSPSGAKSNPKGAKQPRNSFIYKDLRSLKILRISKVISPYTTLRGFYLLFICSAINNKNNPNKLIIKESNKMIDLQEICDKEPTLTDAGISGGNNGKKLTSRKNISIQIKASHIILSK